MAGGLTYVTGAGVDASVNVPFKHHATQPGEITPGIAGVSTPPVFRVNRGLGNTGLDITFDMFILSFKN